MKQVETYKIDMEIVGNPKVISDVYDAFIESLKERGLAYSSHMWMVKEESNYKNLKVVK